MNRRAVYPFAALLALCMVSAAIADAGAATVYVARRGWHIDIGVAVADLAPPLNQVVAELPGARYVFFGFADKHYLLAPKHNAPVLLSALWPGAGIVLATGLPNSPAQAFGAKHVVALSVQAEQMHDLQAFIWRSLRTQGEALKVYQQGPYEGSVYFLAVPKYSAFRTCNTWGADALRAAGFHVHTKGVVFAWQVWMQARRVKRDQDRSAALGASLLGGAYEALTLRRTAD
ncbi:MAG TPA: DUF2459 domain-containing protein [Steroidobacteraceae bacterium]|nr:DUF2459 domain-containing protein [Steroidobacteraceae bacterium]